jgi:hypothetical protein
MALESENAGNGIVSFYKPGEYAPILAEKAETVGEVVKAILSLKVPIDDIEGLEGLEVTLLQRIVLVQAVKAARGNLAAFQELVKHHSYDGAQRIAISQKQQVEYIDRGSRELMRIMNVSEDQLKYSMAPNVPEPASSFLD